MKHLVVTRESAFETKFLENFEVELLIGQVSTYISLCLYIKTADVVYSSVISRRAIYITAVMAMN